MIDPRSIRNRLNASPSRGRTRAAAAPRLAGGPSASLPPAAGKCKARVRAWRSARRAARWPPAAAAARRARRAPVDGKRAFALNQTARDIIGDGGDDRIDGLAFGHQHAAMARILKKTISALIVRHVDKRDHVEEEARMLALGQRKIEQVDALRRLIDDGLERALERFQAADFELAHFRDRFGALRVLDPRLPDRGCKVGLGRNIVGLVVHRLVFSSARSAPSVARIRGPQAGRAAGPFRAWPGNRRH